MKIIKYSLSFFSLLCLLSFDPANSNYSLLTEDDFAFAREDNLSPAITIPDSGFESFNIWQCFSINEIEFLRSEVDYGSVHSVPTIQAPNLSFDLDPDLLWDTEKIFSNWNDLIQDANSICIFGAFLQDEPGFGSFWYIEKIKTDNGYWSRNEASENLTRIIF